MRMGARAIQTQTLHVAFALTTGVLVLSGSVSHACVITAPSCESPSNGRISTLYVNPPGTDDVSVFYEYTASGDRPDSFFLVECKSRKGVRIDLPYDDEDWFPPNEVLDYLTEVAISEKQYTLSQIRAGLRELGSDSRMTTLPARHCGCELPKMEVMGCGDSP